MPESKFVAFRTLAVKLINSEGKSITVTALLDECSDTTFVSERVAKELNLKGPRQEGTVNVLGGKSVRVSSKKVTALLSSYDGVFKEEIDMLTTKDLIPKTPVIDWNEFKDNWRYLKEIEIHSSVAFKES